MWSMGKCGQTDYVLSSVYLSVIQPTVSDPVTCTSFLLPCIIVNTTKDVRASHHNCVVGCYILNKLKECGVGCYWDGLFVGALCYADDLILLARVLLHYVLCSVYVSPLPIPMVSNLMLVKLNSFVLVYLLLTSVQLLSIFVVNF